MNFHSRGDLKSVPLCKLNAEDCVSTALRSLRFSLAVLVTLIAEREGAQTCLNQYGQSQNSMFNV
jgi:hypothetical protein